MKFNWGHAITIVFILFAVYILSFVYRSFQMDIDLVAEDYYAQEVAFQERIDNTTNADVIKDLILVEIDTSAINLIFPANFEGDAASGKVHFYRPSQQSLDRTFPLDLNEQNRISFPKQVLTRGRYSLKLEWTKNDSTFFVIKEIVI